MAETENMKEVYFNEYCPKCKHFDVVDYEEPCNECMHEPARQYSHKPIKFEEGE